MRVVIVNAREKTKQWAINVWPWFEHLSGANLTTNIDLLAPTPLILNDSDLRARFPFDYYEHGAHYGISKCRIWVVIALQQAQSLSNSSSNFWLVYDMQWINLGELFAQIVIIRSGFRVKFYLEWPKYSL